MKKRSRPRAGGLWQGPWCDARDHSHGGRTQAVRGLMVILIVTLIKLTGKLITFYGRPSRRVSTVNKGVISISVRLRTLFGCKIVADFTISCQKRASKGLEDGIKRGLFATDFIKTCQV